MSNSSEALPGRANSGGAGMGSKASTGSAYTRFIPREELQGFAAWQPGALRSPGEAPRVHPLQATAAAPTAAQWLARIDKTRAEGRQQGYEEGYRDGMAALEGFKASVQQAASQQLAALTRAYQAELDALQPQLATAVARLGVGLARQVLRCELQQRPEVVAEVAAQAVAAVVHGAQQLVVHVHPQDLPLVEQAAAEALHARSATLQTDARLTRGDVRVSSDMTQVHACMAERWAQAVAHLPAPGTANEPLEPVA
jgi:flagellar assembly protein FliH